MTAPSGPRGGGGGAVHPRCAYVVHDFVALPDGLDRTLRALPRVDRPDTPTPLADDIWSVRGIVMPHRDRDPETGQGWATLGLILRADGRSYALSCQGRHMPLTAGTIFRLDPTVLHGVGRMFMEMCLYDPNRGERGEDYEHSVLTFLAWDYAPGLEPPLGVFAEEASRRVREFARAHLGAGAARTGGGR